MYKPTKKDQQRDYLLYWGGMATFAFCLVVAWRIDELIGAVLASVVYLTIGARLGMRVLVIRSYLGELNGRDVGWAGMWLLMWLPLPLYIVYDDFPIMTGRESTLVQSKSGVTNWLEQVAAATRWTVFEPGGHHRRNGEKYKV